MAQHRPPARSRLRIHPPRRHPLHRRRRPGRLRAALGQPGQPDRLPRAADPDAEGRLARHAQRARPGQSEEGAVRHRVDVRGLRRSARAPAEGDLLGQRQPDRPARRLRRSEALCRSDDARLPPVPRRGHEDRPHLQHLRAAHAAARRPRRAGVHVAGAHERRRHRSSATARRRAASATSPTWSTASSGWRSRTRTSRSTSAIRTRSPSRRSRGRRTGRCRSKAAS